MTDTVPLPLLATYNRVPSGLSASALGAVPTEMSCENQLGLASIRFPVVGCGCPRRPARRPTVRSPAWRARGDPGETRGAHVDESARGRHRRATRPHRRATGLHGRAARLHGRDDDRPVAVAELFEVDLGGHQSHCRGDGRRRPALRRQHRQQHGVGDQHNAGDAFYPIYQGESFFLLWQHLSNVSAGIRARQR